MPTTSPIASSALSRRSPALFLSRRPVWQVCYLSGLVAAVAAESWGLIARVAGVPMRAADVGSHHATALFVGAFAMGTLFVTFFSTFGVVLIARLARRPVRVYLSTMLPLLALSLLPPLTLSATATSTKLVLASGHLVAAAVMIPAEAYRLSAVPRRAGATSTDEVPADVANGAYCEGA